MSVEVEGLRLESILLQPTPRPQCDSTPRRLPAVDTGSDEAGVSCAKTQSTEREIKFRLQASLDGVFHVSCTSLDPEGATVSLQADAGVDDYKTTTTTNAQAAAREKFARPSKKR